MAIGIFLGSDEIKYNGNPVGNMRVGGTNICKGYVGSVLVFDNCAQANSNVVLQLDTTGLSGPSAGYTIGGNLSGFTKSGQPTTSYTAFSTTATVNTSAGYSGSITVSNAPGGTFPSPGGTTTIVTTTITGSVSSPIPPVNSSISYNTSGITGWTSSAGQITPAAPATISGAPNSTRNWNVVVTLNAGWQGNVTGQGSQGGVFPSTNNSTYTAVLGGSVSQTQYTYQWNFSENLTGATASYNVDGTGSTFSSSAGPISVSGTLGQTSTATISGSPNGSNVWQGSDPTYSNGSSQTITFGPSTNGGSQTLGISGTASAPVGTISLYNYNGSCANDSCINKGSGSLTTFYYYGTDENSATLYTTNNSGVLSGSVSTGYYAKSTSGQSFNYSPGSSSTVSCIPSVVYTAVATGGAPCGNPLVDYWYINGGFTAAGPLNFVSSTADGCGGTSVTINDGNYWTTTSAAGYGASNGSC